MEQRQLKFRAWKKDDERMIGTEYDYLCVGSDLVVMVKYVPTGTGMYEPKTVKQFTNPEVDNLILMQFTGLHDKNGREIYEGDVVLRKVYHSEDDTWVEGSYKVIWKDAAFELQTPEKRFGMLLGGEDKFCEVLGNIYENPTLLSSNKE